MGVSQVDNINLIIQIMKVLKKRITKEVAQYAADELAKIFPKKEVEPAYSKGFQIWSKMSFSKRKPLILKHNFVVKDCIAELEARA